jgi:hypothetical protein
MSAPTMTGTTSSSTKPGTALPLSYTLRDLAILRSSDVDLAAVLAVTGAAASTPKTPPSTESDAVDAAVAASYELAREARAAVRLRDRGDADAQGARIDELRAVLEDVHAALGAGTAAGPAAAE